MSTNKCDSEFHPKSFHNNVLGSRRPLINFCPDAVAEFSLLHETIECVCGFNMIKILKKFVIRNHLIQICNIYAFI